MHNKTFAIASIFAAIAVLLGAFGAHGLKQIASPDLISTFETGVRYQFYHSFAMLITALAWNYTNNKWLIWANRCFITGIILFSGSIYVLVLMKSNSDVGLAGLGILTPIGGLFLIAGWIFLALAALKRSNKI